MIYYSVSQKKLLKRLMQVQLVAKKRELSEQN
jgi:hypothetical protein